MSEKAESEFEAEKCTICGKDVDPQYRDTICKPMKVAPGPHATVAEVSVTVRSHFHALCVHCMMQHGMRVMEWLATWYKEFYSQGKPVNMSLGGCTVKFQTSDGPGEAMAFVSEDGQ